MSPPCEWPLTSVWTETSKKQLYNYESLVCEKNLNRTKCINLEHQRKQDHLDLTMQNRRLEPGETGQPLEVCGCRLWSYSKLIHCCARTSSLRGTQWMERVTSTRRPTERPLLQCQLSKGDARPQPWHWVLIPPACVIQYLFAISDNSRWLLSFYILNMTHLS